MDLRNHLVRFKMSDIFMPDPASLLWQLHGSDLLQGRVLELSDSGAQRQVFAIVEVEGMEQPLIVPVEHILDVTD